MDVTVGASGADYTVDGVNDEVEINAAMAAVSDAGGGIVELIDASYTTDAFLVPRSNVHLKGLGKTLSTIQAKSGSTMNRMMFNYGQVAGDEVVTDFLMTGITFDVNNLQCMGAEIWYYNGVTFLDCELKNILCIGVGGASRWGWKFGTISFVTGVEATKSYNLTLLNNSLHDNFTRTFETLLVTNTKKGTIAYNDFENNSSLTANYDEISIFIYCDDVHVFQNTSLNSEMHGFGTKESQGTRIFNNTITKNTLFPVGYKAFRSFNSVDVDIHNNTVNFPAFEEINFDVTDLDDPITINGTTITTTSTLTLNSGNTDNFGIDMRIYGDNIPEGASIKAIDSSTIFRINKTISGLLTGETANLSARHTGFELADRQRGFDGHSQRFVYTKNTYFRENTINNAYTGINSGLASIDADTTAQCDVSGTTVTLNSAIISSGGVDTSYTDPVEMVQSISVGMFAYGVAIPYGATVTAIDEEAGTVTISEAGTTASDTEVFFDGNTIDYKAQDVFIENNTFGGIKNSFVAWNYGYSSTDSSNIRVNGNTIGDWYGSLIDCIRFIGKDGDVSAFSDIVIKDNVIGDNLEGTNNGAIAVDSATARCVSGNTISSYGTRGEYITRDDGVMGTDCDEPVIESIIVFNGTITPL